TSWVLVFGNQVVHNAGDVALFGLLLFQFLTLIQLTLAILFAPLLAAGAVAQEKDRGTLSLLLLTRLHDSELVVGQLAASLLTMANLLAAGAPVFLCAARFGGFSFEQVARAYAVTACAALAAGSLGTLFAFWREKTFQTLALSLMTLLAWIGFWEAAAVGAFGTEFFGTPAATCAAWASPFRALEAAVSGGLELALPSGFLVHPADCFCVGALLATVLLLATTTWRVRAWNTSGARRDETALAERESLFAPPGAPSPAEGAAAPAAPVVRKPYRSAWDQPILWREVATWAYGKKILFVRVAYLLLAAVAAAALWRSGVLTETLTPIEAVWLTVPIMLVSLLLINALAVNSFCTERDGRTLDLLLVTDLSPGEIVYGKLAGILWNAKEMVLVPLLLTILVWRLREQGYPVLTDEEFWYTMIGLVVMDLFAAVLGIHVGMHYANSRAAMAVSLGTVIFLFIGVASCMRMIVAFGGSFQMQFLPFAAMIFGGGVGMFVALGLRNPSPAIAYTSCLLPVATFYAIISFLLDKPHFVFIVTTLTYSFAIASMLIPAVSEFDVATGRTTGPED
ncbi:MAG TPA: hypothetical protein VGE52_09450, partial [Pirellulales bacterium]